MAENEPVTKDVEFIERFGRWIGEVFEKLGEGSGGVLRRFLRSRNARLIDRYAAIVKKINGFEAAVARLSQDEMKAKVGAWKARLKDKSRDEQQAILDEILPEAFALVREASKRTIGLRHFDVQMLGGIVLHEGKIAEMATGEGKTLVATSPAFLNALAGRGVYIVTVNDYLARRDAEWMGPVHQYLGLTVGCIQSTMDPWVRQPEYAADITYGTNNEYGFDYLRDNMKSRADLQVQKHLHYAIVDEVDSILVDEARTPLIISGMPEQSTRKYYVADGVARRLVKGKHFEVKEKEHTVILTEDGIEEAQKLVGVPTFYDGPHMDWPHHIEQALRAHNLYHLDKEYVKRIGEDGAPEIVIVDEFTGRMMPGRRWSDGLHQAVEAKEGIRIREENQTLATITFQNYFKLYWKIAGMTGTAMTEAAEFSKIYELDVVQIPTNRKNVRVDRDDLIYRAQKEKFPFVVQEIVALHKAGRPVLVGTASIEKSELCARYLTEPQLMTDVVLRRAKHAEESLGRVKVPDELKEKVRDILARPARLDGEKARAVAEQVVEAAPRSDLAFWIDGVAKAAEALDAIRAGVPHNVLNAKNHEREAEFVAQAGRIGAVTIATNMAGRGTDILLGGNPEFLARTEMKTLGLDWKVEEARYKELLDKARAQCEVEKQKVVGLGGLHVLGTERHEARRIDNQLRGRCARQGDPGSSSFYLSLEDDLMRIFANDRVQRILELVGMTEDVDIQSGMVSRSIRRAQKRVEDRNFEIRKNLLEYDEVMDKQRRTVYGLRQEVLEGSDVKERILDMVGDDVERVVGVYINERPEKKDYEDAAHAVNQKFGTAVDGTSFYGRAADELTAALIGAARELYEKRESLFGAETLRRIERGLLLQVIDTKWKDHLINVDALRSGIGLRSYGQIDPKNEFKKEGFRLFEEMLASIGDEVLMVLYRLKPEAPPQNPPQAPPDGAPVPAGDPSLPAAGAKVRAPATEPAPIDGVPKLGRPAVVPKRPLEMPKPQPVPAPAPTPTNEQQATRKAMDSAAGVGAAGGATRNVSAPIGRAAPSRVPRVGRNEDCPCGSGKKYKKCHGASAA